MFKSTLTVHDHNRNLIFNIFHEMSWGFGMAFNSIFAVVPLFLKQLNAPDIVISSVMGIFTISIAIPQLYSAYLGRNIKNLKLACIGIHTLTVPPIFMAGFIFAFLGPTGSTAWILYYICLIFFTLAIGFVLPIWADFLDTVHLREKRGSFFGISFAFNSAAGILGGLSVRKLLTMAPFPQNFGYGFLIYTSCVVLSIIMFIPYRTRKVTRNSQSKTFTQFISEAKTTFLQDSNFKRYVFSRAILTANYPAISLYAAYSYDKLNFPISEAGTFTLITGIFAAFSNFFTGKIGDLFGHKRAMVIVFIAYLCALITTLLATTLTQTYLIFAFLGLGMGGFWTSAMSLVYEFAGEKDKKIYFALTDTLTAPFVLIFIILTGILIPVIGIPAVLILLGVFLIIGILSLIFVTKEPKTIHTDLHRPLPL